MTTGDYQQQSKCDIYCCSDIALPAAVKNSLVMKNSYKSLLSVALLFIFSLIHNGLLAQGQSAAAMGLGQYRLNEPFSVTQAQRRSIYLPMRDGVRLAVDYYLPVINTKVSKEKRPTVFAYTRYGRAVPLQNGQVYVDDLSTAVNADGTLSVSAQASPVALLLAYGYAVVVADMRGSGASFGPSHAEGDDIEGKDGADIIAWIARQSWSNGKVGMYGVSYLAEVQPRVAAENPSALKALSMVRAFFDGPNGGYAMGGVFRAGWLGGWNSMVAEGDNRSTEGEIDNIAAVDADRDKSLLRLAVAEHRAGVEAMEYFKHLDDFKSKGVLRDELKFIDQYQLKGQNNLHTLLPRVNAVKVPALLFGGWYDLYPNDMLYWYANLQGTTRLIFSPQPHCCWGPQPAEQQLLNREDDQLQARETLRWFDYWLRSIQNDALERAAVQYALLRQPQISEWFAARSWPDTRAQYCNLHLSAQRAQSIDSQNDGSLQLRSDDAATRQPWQVDYSTSLGDTGTRWQISQVFETDMTVNDLKSLTYTSERLGQDWYVAGIPVLRIMLSAENVRDADVYAYLSAVAEDGTSRLVSEGILRASHRTLGSAPYKNFDLPFPTSISRDVAVVAPLSVQPVPLEFALMAVGRIFAKGERIRLTLAGADRGNTTTAEQKPAPLLGVHLGGDFNSVLRLPVLNAAGTSVCQ
jgi:uncharacterized protein